MRTKFAVLLIAISALLSSHTVQAQEKLDDLVPFKKAGKWGLAHIDGSMFYPAVFDSLLIFRSGREFEGHITEQLSIFPMDFQTFIAAMPVMYKKQRMFLTEDKKLLTKAALKARPKPGPPRIVRAEPESIENSKQADTIDLKPFPYNEMLRYKQPVTLKTKTYEQVQISFKGNDSSAGYKFIIQGDYYPEFDCDEVILSPYEEKTGVFTGALIRRKYKSAYVDFEKHKLTIAFPQFSSGFPIKYSKQWPDWLIGGKAGVITKSGQQIGRLFRWTDGLDFDYEQPGKAIVVESSSDVYQFYYPEFDSLAPATFEKLGEYDCNYQAPDKHEPWYYAIKNNKEGLIKQDGTVILPLEYDYIFCLDAHFLLLEKDGLFGVARVSNGRLILPKKYYVMLSAFSTFIEKEGEPYFIFLVKRNGQTFFVDNFGKEWLE